MKRNTGAPGRRKDGATTKAQLLEAAGALFAAKGFDRTTAKEIAERAGTNAAAVNYYFAGIENLYGQVLVEAHRRLVSLQALASVVEADEDPRQRFRRVVELIVGAVTSPESSWAVRVLTREILSPTPHSHALRQEIGPKISLVLGLVADLVGLPREHPAVARTCFSIMAPCLMLLVADRQPQLVPEFGAVASDARALADHMIGFALGGIANVANIARREAPRRSSARRNDESV